MLCYPTTVQPQSRHSNFYSNVNVQCNSINVSYEFMNMQNNQHQYSLSFKFILTTYCWKCKLLISRDNGDIKIQYTILTKSESTWFTCCFFVVDCRHGQFFIPFLRHLIIIKCSLYFLCIVICGLSQAAFLVFFPVMVWTVVFPLSFHEIQRVFVEGGINNRALLFGCIAVGVIKL